MIRKLLMALVVMTISVGAWAQSANFATSDEGKTLTITATGDVSSLSFFMDSLTGYLNSGVTTVKFEGSNITISKDIFQKIVSAASVATADFGNTYVASYDDLFAVTFGTALTSLTYPTTSLDANGDMVLPQTLILWNQWGSRSNFAVIIPEGFTKIADNAFYTTSNNCGVQYLASVTLPSSLKEIGKYAFAANSALAKVTYSSYDGDYSLALPANVDKVDDAAFAGCIKLNTILLNSGLRFIGNSAFYLSAANKTQEVLKVPASVKYMGPASFCGRWFKDVYFSSVTAPICPLGNCVFNHDLTNASTFDANVYMGNNGFNPTPSTDAPNADNAKPDANNNYGGYANRENYHTQAYYFGFLHYPSGLSPDNHNTYEDVLRLYMTYDYDESNQYCYGKLGFDYNTANGGGIKIIGSSDSETVMAFGSFQTEAVLGKYNLVTPGFVDTYKGEQYIWPSQSQWMRAYCTNSCGYQWDGVTAYRPTLTSEEIALMVEDGEVCIDGTAVTLTSENVSSYSDGLSKIAHMGTRQFVLADADSQTTTDYQISMKGENWWTICVPFNMTKAQVDEVFGVKTHVCLFSEVIRDATSSPKKIELRFQNDVYAHKTVKDADGKYAANFSKQSAAAGSDDIVIYAHEAYMIYPTKGSKDAVTMYSISDYNIETGSPVPTIVTATDNTEYRFIGNYSETVTTMIRNAQGQITGATVSPMTVPAYSYVYASADNGNTYKFWFLTDSQMTWKPNKCVVQATDKDGGVTDSQNFFGNSSNTKQITVLGEFPDEDATGVEQVAVVAGENAVSGVVYNLNGQIVSNKGLNGLRKGVYVMNGKKCTVR